MEWGAQFKLLWVHTEGKGGLIFKKEAGNAEPLDITIVLVWTTVKAIFTLLGWKAFSIQVLWTKHLSI